MYSSSDTGVNNVPAFLTKLWTLVEDSSTDDLIAWDLSGMSFHVYDQARFSKEILPLYFKHNNIASFIRQLNMYGFRKVVHIEAGSIKCETDDVEFYHPYFIRGQEDLLENIKRKSSNSTAVVNIKAEPSFKVNPEDVTRVLTDVKLMKGKQESLSSKMDKMKKENEALWREVASLRQKHVKQQQIVNKLIQFMIHLVGGNSGLPGSSLPKRKLPLMIKNNAAQEVVPPKRVRYNKQLSIEELQDANSYMVASPQDVISYPEPTVSPELSGPVIHDVTDSALSPLMSNHSYAKPDPSSSKEIVDLEVDCRPDTIDNSLGSADLNNLLQVVEMPSNNTTVDSTNLLDRNELTDHLDTMQDELDSLKDLFSGQYNFDASTLMSLFAECTVPTSVDQLLEDDSKDDLQTLNSTAPTSMTTLDPNTIMGHELIQYQPDTNFLSNIVDLSDIIDDDSHIQTSAINPGENDPFIEIDPLSFINTPSGSHMDNDIDPLTEMENS